MKEATGELNITVVVVISVGILIAFFYYTLWPMLNTNFEQNASCAKAVCPNPCGPGNNTCAEIESLVTCYTKNNTEVKCPWKG